MDEGLASQLDLVDKTVVFVGRLNAMTRRMAIRHLAAGRGTRVRYALTRPTDFLVVGHGAAVLIDDGRLHKRLQRAGRIGAVSISENTLLRSIALLPRPNRAGGTLELHAIASLGGLDPDAVRLLALFDLIEPAGGLFDFADLLAVRTAARLLKEGVPMSAVVQSMLTLRQANRAQAPLASLTSIDGAIIRTIDGCVGELDGQLRLPFPESANVAVEDLYAEAEQAEDKGDWLAAASLYQRCLAIDRSDPTPAFNLANVLCKLGRQAEAQLQLRLAVGMDPAFAEAWYNLAHLLEDEGRTTEAAAHLRKAIDADPDYGDALYNLAQLCLAAGEYAEAAAMWHRYLQIDPDSAWARKARRGVLLCRLHLGGAAHS